jgi:gamma-glutamylcyclotransferase
MALPVFGRGENDRGNADFTWFVYGSSLDAASFAAWAQEHGYQMPDLSRGRPARLEGFRISFDVVSRAWGGAVATVVEAPGDFVEGIALPMPGSARALVDHKEGARTGFYRPFDVVVVPLAGGPSIPAVAYRVAPGRRLPAEGPPAVAYLDALVRGARALGLSAAWIERLEHAAGQ